ncbi:hypothetical protein HELRODRAFT_167470 [Helobdella robusta]|uniref:Uncharacterized protein n=1 Tax=Helobdella robusta TaxID=6412 RepID=T1EZE9_HELRO|nr:hypothetical protein HELRODRAFT_167470 [Helobdella robusta]ESO10959.1 hypothetical protein HELRODRAFT_167470 [Helobdella robusta]
MLELHKNCHLLCIAEPIEATLNFDNFFSLQNKYLMSKLTVMPVRNETEACQCMDTLAKAHHKKGASILWDKLSTNLETGLTDPNKIISPFRHSGFSEHECFLLLDTLGSVENISTASFYDILKAVQCRKLANKTFNFFNNNI